MTNRIVKPKPRAIVATPWFIRKTFYLVVGVVGLISVAFGIASPDQVDNWLAQAASLGATLGGFYAGVNTGRASDETPAQEAARLAPQVAPVQQVSTYDTLRDRMGVNYAD